jgi:hypothetical protein
MENTVTVIDQLRAVIKAHKDSLEALRERIAELLDPIPVGVVLSDEQGEVCRIIRVCTGASQWANRTWDVTIRGKGALSPDGKLICELLRDKYWDGNNLHYRKTEPTCSYEGGEIGDELQWLSSRETRAIAARLPAAIARYMETCKVEAEANDQTLAR